MCGSCDLQDLSYAKEVLFGMLYRKNFSVEYADTFPVIRAKLNAAARDNPKLRKYAVKLSRAPLWMDRMTGSDIYDNRLPNNHEDLTAEDQLEHEHVEHEAATTFL
jgi:hypothetical protein